MKRIARHIDRFLLTLALALLFSACNSSPEIGDYDDTPNGLISIAHLKSLLKGNSNLLSDDVSVSGYVIANDMYGELYKEIVISDESGGIAVAVDVEKSATKFPLYAHLTISCSGLQIGQVNGRPTLGTQSENGYRVERLTQGLINRHILIDKTSPQTIEPQQVTIEEITTKLAGNFIRLDGVEFCDDAGKTWCEKDSDSGEYEETTRYAYDESGNKIGVRISAYCNYRSEKIPTGKGVICGVVEVEDKTPLIRIIQHQINF